MWSGGALAMVCVAGGLTMTVEKTVLLQDDVADIGFRAGTDIPAQQIIAAQAQLNARVILSPTPDHAHPTLCSAQ